MRIHFPFIKKEKLRDAGIEPALLSEMGLKSIALKPLGQSRFMVGILGNNYLYTIVISKYSDLYKL